MFTGVIEEIGTAFPEGGNTLVIECLKVLEDVKLGDSISIDGVCQTVVEFDKNSFKVQVSEETLNVTTLRMLKSGTKVNLERALAMGDRFGGHIVTGHVDGPGKVKSIQKLSEFYNINVEADSSLTKYIAKKGSITLNGISLTIANIVNSEFSIAVIPHSFENTNLKFLKSGDFVNLEVDILAKYVENFLSTGNNKTIDQDFLRENGFI